MSFMTTHPSKRPSVKSVKEWDLLFEDSILDHWRGAENDCTVEVWNGHPFPDFYKVVVLPHSPSKKKYSKLFYGESAWSQVNMFVYDLGFTRWDGV